MNNYEFHKEAIEMLYREEIPFAVTERNVVVGCRAIGCGACIFSSNKNPNTPTLLCGDRKMMWALREHVEQPKLTKREKQFVDMMGADLYLARDEEGSLVLFDDCPQKENDYWFCCSCVAFDMRMFEGLNFSFIKWEDDKPWDVTMLSELEVEEGD